MASEELLSNVREWMAIDNDMKRLSKEMKTLRERKKVVTGALVNVMQDNEIDCFNTSTGKLVHASRTARAPLSKKHLVQSLATYFKGDTELAGELGNHIMSTRDVKKVETIQRKEK
jgi:hypothetical protein